MEGVFQNKAAWDVMFNYEGEKWAFDLVEYLLRKILSKEDATACKIWPTDDVIWREPSRVYWSSSRT